MAYNTEVDGNFLENLYSPSKWCKRFKTSDECLNEHVKICSERSEVVRKSIPALLEVPYGRMQKEKYDLFGTDLPENSPIVFYIHGGYWQEEIISKNVSSFIASSFYKNNIKTFIIGYELCPKVKLENIFEQTERALLACLEYAKLKNSRGIFLMGHSAGAHLVAHFFTNFEKTLSSEENNLLKGAFLIGGVYDLKPLLQTSYNEALKLTSSEAQLFSVLDFTCDFSTKFFIIVGRNDSPAFVSQSEMLQKRLNEKKVSAELLILENIDHFDIIENLYDEGFQLTKLMLREIM